MNTHVHRRRMQLGVMLLLPAAAVVLAIVALGDGGPGAEPCAEGRTCVPDAGISLVLARGWEAITPQDDDVLLAAAPGGERDQPVGLLIKDAAAELGVTTVPGSIADLEEAVRTYRDLASTLLAATTEIRCERVRLEAGPAVRLDYGNNVLFYGEFGITEYWLLLGNRALLVMFTSGVGDDADSPATQAMAASIRPLWSGAN